jgi:hypothetical protein
MKTNYKMPCNDRDYAESDISDNKKKASIQEQQSQANPSKTDNGSKEKDKGTYIKDMPEIIPARTGVI